jgi:hypothetical protein
MRAALVLLGAVACVNANATTVERRELSQLVRAADHVLVATVTKVDMVDGKGMEVKDRAAMTGPSPGMQNEIRVHLEVRSVLFSRSKRPHEKPIVRLWKEWHYSLGQIQDAMVGNTSIFLLKGDRYDPVYPAYFERPVEERKRVEALLKALGRK